MWGEGRVADVIITCWTGGGAGLLISWLMEEGGPGCCCNDSIYQRGLGNVGGGDLTVAGEVTADLVVASTEDPSFSRLLICLLLCDGELAL